MKVGVTISALLHAGVLAWALISISGKPFTSTEALAVDVISKDEFSKITAGSEKAEKKETPKPLVEKIAEKKPVEDPTPKVTEKREIVAAKEPPPPPPPAPEPKAEPQEKKQPEPKADPIAETIKKEESKQPAPQKAEAKAPPIPPKKPPMPKQQPKFDPNKIAALLDKQEPQRMAATGEALNREPSLGRVNGNAVRLSQSELDALRRRISECWTPPIGAANATNLLVVFRVVFNPNGTIRLGPDVVEATASSHGPAFAESAKRAILQCQPYTMLRPETYQLWKDMEVGFRPSDMFRG
jgi:colicin import membrane protein